MKTTNLIILCIIIVCACSTRNNSNNISVADLEIIPVDLNNVTKDASSFLDKIEIIPLETNDSSLIPLIQKIVYNKQMDMYAMFSMNQIVYTFKGNGEYIGNSKKMKGQGPEEYGMVLDFCFNPYVGGIDMLNPYGTIYTYSPTFELITKRQYTPEFPIDRLLALDSVNYIFTHPFIWTDQELSFVNINTQQVITTTYKGTISGEHSMESSCFHHIGEQFYYIPTGVNYYIFQIDTVQMKTIPIMYLNFGDNEIKEAGLPGRASAKRVSDNKVRNVIIEQVLERMEYLRDSGLLLPMIKFISEDYVYIYNAKGLTGYGTTFLYNRKKKESYVLKENETLLIPPGRGLVDNVLFILAPPEIDQISQVVDYRFMSPEEISKLESLDEEDNPVIVKYYLKK